jgi:hypothetical protein
MSSGMSVLVEVMVDVLVDAPLGDGGARPPSYPCAARNGSHRHRRVGEGVRRKNQMSSGTDLPWARRRSTGSTTGLVGEVE